MSPICRRTDEAEKQRQVARALCDGENCRIHGEVALMMTDLETRCSLIEIAAPRRNETGILPRTCLAGQARPNIDQEGVDAEFSQITCLQMGSKNEKRTRQKRSWD